MDIVDAVMQTLRYFKSIDTVSIEPAGNMENTCLLSINQPGRKDLAIDRIYVCLYSTGFDVERIVGINSRKDVVLRVSIPAGTTAEAILQNVGIIP